MIKIVYSGLGGLMGKKDELIVYLIKNGIYKFNKYQLWELSKKQLEKLIKKVDKQDQGLEERR
ncbi:Fur-regulated basic protein FbpA [Bacillus paramycoides]|uniref:Fur-regulated basic protein FbpA n=1 Tax=Bacillus paramycoides TaxID=2026194 RepID=UPI0031837D12